MCGWLCVCVCMCVVCVCGLCVCVCVCMCDVCVCVCVCVAQRICCTVLLQVRCEIVEKETKSARHCYNCSWKHSCVRTLSNARWHLWNREVPVKGCFALSHSHSPIWRLPNSVNRAISLKSPAHALTDSLQCCSVQFQIQNVSQFNNHAPQCTQHPAPLITVTSNKL